MLKNTSAWQALERHYAQMQNTNLRQLFADNPQRFNQFSLQFEHLLLDYSKNLITQDTLQLLVALAEQSQLKRKINAMFAGEKINLTENRAVCHTALRADLSKPLMVDDIDIHQQISKSLEKMMKLSDAILQEKWLGDTGKRITDVVNLGIGGSDLGPHMVCHALKPFSLDKVRCHFVSNVDGTHLAETIQHLNPDRTLFIVASKTFTTIETLSNAVQAKHWLLSHNIKNIHKHFIALTSAPDKAKAFGIEETLEMYEWVGGRYSLWSSIGFSIMLLIGSKHFKELLLGARAMDQHFTTAPFEKNMPVILALLGIWYHNFFGASSYAVIPYNQYLTYFCDFLQQLDMESNGKSVTQSGEMVDYKTGPIVWGGLGTNSQHAFHQLLHQGTELIPVDFIATVKTHNPLGQQNKILYANCLSQSQALMTGKTLEEATNELIDRGMNEQKAKCLAPHKMMPGNRPSNTLVLEDLNPYTLGSLIALYEHKVFVQGVIWDIHSFDQWGVELGKKLANQLLPIMQQHAPADTLDSSTKGLLTFFQRDRHSL